ncbi:MAG: 16S rRNA (uracil(1498)-N(3))-methyltransferase [Methylococcales bacterium]|nr:16S rRNA (uracil(1498)-N(3))-methyltransferase [Methylococcales bacterium]MBT7443654.1 16S rRNA (uracil(1498)-N(3))-methyltransferase [Methylococcales bacterium]
MNILLLEPSDFISDDTVSISGRRYSHLVTIKRVKLGDVISVGVLSGLMGTAVVEKISDDSVALTVSLSDEPPIPAEVHIVLALPRPKMLKRILQSIASLGVKRVFLINSQKVEKSYWQSPALQPEVLRQQLILGLEQGKDTLTPEITLHKGFKPFVEDILPGEIVQRQCVLAHPKLGDACHLLSQEKPVTFVVGPEGGFTPYEVNLLLSAGAKGCQLGARILKVETALPVLLSAWLH